MDLVGRSMLELKQIAEELGIKNVSKLRKNELLDALLEYEEKHKDENSVSKDRYNDIVKKYNALLKKRK